MISPLKGNTGRYIECTLHAGHPYKLVTGSVTGKHGLNCLEDKWWAR